jgi:hypothetical protein
MFKISFYQTKGVKMNGRILLLAALFSSLAHANQEFGYRGRNGQSAVNGYDGRTGGELNLDVKGATQTYDLRGENGENASGQAQDGDPAYNCQQPYETPYNLYGAPGGSGGDGARGGDGGNGGRANLYIPSLAKISLLKSLTIINSGGQPGANSPNVGNGAPGCRCQWSNWTLYTYTWELFYKQQNGQRTSTGERQKTSTHNSPPDRGTGYDWELVSTERDYYQCTNGSWGSNGEFGRPASAGYYGWVNILVGADSKTEVIPSIYTTVGKVMNNTYTLSQFWQEKKVGLRSILSSASNVSDEYYLGTYNKRKVKFEWTAKKTPTEAEVQNETATASIKGPIEKPIVRVSLPLKLKHKIVETPDTTVVTVTHVLNSTDPEKIAACAKHDAKGSYLCEFSGRCVYETGYCLPR